MLHLESPLEVRKELQAPLVCTKISAAGNDFLCIDNRSGCPGHPGHPGKLPLEDTERTWIARLCHRRFGLGADGVLVWEHPEPISGTGTSGADLRMRLFNADSSEAEMCGNGLRALCLFAAMNGLKLPLYRIQTQAGCYTARYETVQAQAQAHAQQASRACITTSMPFAKDFIENIPLHTAQGVPRIGHYVRVGVPHLLLFLDEETPYSLEEEGPYFRHHQRFAPEGVNVHFIVQRKGIWHYRSYERGVEAETWACGTGATAIAAYLLRHQLATLPLVLMPFSGIPLTLQASSMDCHAELELQAEAVALFTLSITPHV